MNNIQIFAKALIEQIEVARVRQLSGLKESANIKHTDTARAIRIFQKNLGLDQTGVPDPKTMHMIKMVAEAEQSWWGRNMPTWLGGDPAKPAAPPPKPGAPATQPAGGAPASKSDPAVLKQQQDLIAKGAKIKADGIMGPATQAAIKQFGGAAPAAPAAAPAASPNPNANEFEIAQAQAAGGAGAAPGKSSYAPAAPAAPTAPKPPAAPAAPTAPKPPAASDTTTAGGAAMANKPAAAPAAGSVQSAAQPIPGVNNGGAQANDDAGGMTVPAAGSVQSAAQPTPGVNNGGAQANDDAGGMTAPAAPKKGLIPQSTKDAMMAQVKAMTAAQAGGAAAPAANPAAGAAAMANSVAQGQAAAKPAAKLAAPADGTNGLGAGATMEGRFREDPELTAMLRIAGLR